MRLIGRGDRFRIVFWGGLATTVGGLLLAGIRFKHGENTRPANIVAWRELTEEELYPVKVPSPMEVMDEIEDLANPLSSMGQEIIHDAGSMPDEHIEN